VPFPPPPSPSPRLSGLTWLLIGGGAIAAIAVIGLIILGLLATGALGPVTSSDGRMSVKVPQGWAQGHAAPSGDRKPVLVLARVKRMNGVEPHFIVADSGQYLPLAELEAGWTRYVESGKFPIAGTIGLARRTTVAGAPALAADFQGSKFAGQLVFVDYANKTYLVEMSSDASEFAELRGSDFATILSSWQWH
jgi:hypothetical protein